MVQISNIWATTLEDRIVHSYFIDGILNKQKYLQLLDVTLSPTITQLLQDDDNLVEGRHLTFQHDSVPSHFLASLRHFLYDILTGK